MEKFTLNNCFQGLYKDPWFLSLPVHFRISLKMDLDGVYTFWPRKKGHPANGSYCPVNTMFKDFN